MRLLITILLCLNAVAGFAKKWYVDKSGLTIQQTVNKCMKGDTVLVLPGTYYEKNLVIKTPIVLKGINYPKLEGEKKYEVVSIKSDNVTVDGFMILHSGNTIMEDPAGIKIYNTRNVVIQNNILKDNFFGIYTQNGTACIIRNNTISSFASSELSAGNGIHCWKCDSMLITGNTVKGHRDGIYFEFVTNSMIEKNLSTQNLRYGLHFMFSNNDAYIKNIFRNNGAGVAVMFTHGVKMLYNVFEENWGDASYGLFLKEIGDSHIEGNIFSNNTTGIVMEGASRVGVTKNRFEKNGWAMKVDASCMDVTVEKNNFKGNTFDVGTNGSLVLSVFHNNYWDKYEGYDLNKDKVGDIPYRPVSLFSMIIEKLPPAMMLFRSIMVSLLDKTEKIIPGITPENLKDDAPLMKPLPL